MAGKSPEPQSEVIEAYEEVRLQLKLTPVASLRHKLFKRLAALVSAATKRAKREFVLEHLLQAKLGGLDITITVARHSVARVLGRNVSRSEVIQKFGSPGRTASEKSPVRAKELAAVEQSIIASLQELEIGMIRVRSAVKHENQGKWV